MTKVGKLIILIWLLSSTYTMAEEIPKIPHFVMGIYLPGVNDEVNITDIRVAMDYWLKEISHDLNIFDSHTEFFVNMKDMNESFKNNQLDMIIAPPLSIAKHFNLKELADNGMVGVRENGQMNSLILLVKNDSAITSLADLRGKRLLMQENDELCEVFIDTKVRKLTQMGYKQFFSSVSHEIKHSRMILDLFFGKTDAALVYLRAYDVTKELNPQIKNNTKILLSYPLRSKNYTFFSRKFQHSQIILNNISRFTDNPRGQQLLELFKTEEIVDANIEELMPIKALYEEYLRLNSENRK